jgi:hypothetical protein
VHLSPPPPPPPPPPPRFLLFLWLVHSTRSSLFHMLPLSPQSTQSTHTHTHTHTRTGIPWSQPVVCVRDTRYLVCSSASGQRPCAFFGVPWFCVIHPMHTATTTTTTGGKVKVNGQSETHTRWRTVAAFSFAPAPPPPLLLLLLLFSRASSSRDSCSLSCSFFFFLVALLFASHRSLQNSRKTHQRPSWFHWQHKQTLKDPRGASKGVLRYG